MGFNSGFKGLRDIYLPVCKDDFFPVHVMKAHGEVEVELHSFLTSNLNGRELSNLHTCRMTPGHRIHRTLLDRKFCDPPNRSGGFGGG